MSVASLASANYTDSRVSQRVLLSLNVLPTLGIRHIDDATAQKVALVKVAVGHFRLTFDATVASDREIRLVSAMCIPATAGQVMTCHQVQLTASNWRNVIEVQCYVAGVLTDPNSLTVEATLFGTHAG